MINCLYAIINPQWFLAEVEMLTRQHSPMRKPQIIPNKCLQWLIFFLLDTYCASFLACFDTVLFSGVSIRVQCIMNSMTVQWKFNIYLPVVIIHPVLHCSVRKRKSRQKIIFTRGILITCTITVTNLHRTELLGTGLSVNNGLTLWHSALLHFTKH
jgi:hypothetical protein